MSAENLGPCWKCGETIWATQGREQMLRKSGERFHCIWGHEGVFRPGPTEADKLRSKLQKQEQATERARAEFEQERRWRQEANEEKQHVERRLAAQRGVTTRLKNRVANGVCPCCNRTFLNLGRHMSTKHAGFVAEEVQAQVSDAVH